MISYRLQFSEVLQLRFIIAGFIKLIRKVMNKWTVALAIAGIVSMSSIASAQEAENQVLTAVSGTTISGYVDTSMNWQFGADKTSAGRVNDSADSQNGFNLNSVKIGIGKALEEDASIWAAGYQADFRIGPDARMYRNTFGAGDEFAIQNAYVDLRAPIGNGLDFRFGVFESIIGYESSDSYENPNFSRSYGFSLQPRQNVGGLISYNFDLSDWILGVRAGIANSYSNFDYVNVRYSDSARLSYMGALNLIFPESTGFLEGTEVYFGVINGLEDYEFNNQAQPNYVNYYAGITMPLPVEGLRFGFAYDYRYNDDRAPAVQSTWANAFAAYLSYDVTDKLTLANRLEYANGSCGTYLMGNADYTNWGTGESDKFLSDTVTVSYKLWENVLTRVEFRWDNDISGNGRATDTADKDNAFGITGNIVYMF